MKLFQNEEGFTLIEVMMALVIGLTLILSFSRIFSSGLQSEREMDEKLEARRVTDDIVEYLRNNINEFANENSNSIRDDINDYINENREKEISIYFGESDSDVEIIYHENNSLYKFQINWSDRNYQKEAFIYYDQN